MIPFPADRESTPAADATIYRKHLIVLDPSLKLSANSTTVDKLDDYWVLAIEHLLKERNARTVGGGQWALSWLRMEEGLKMFELVISFRRYGDDFVDTLETAELDKVVIGDGWKDRVKVSEKTTTITMTQKTEMEMARVDGVEKPDSFGIDSNFESTVGPRSPTPISDLGSSASTPVPAVIRSESEIQSDELDRMEEVTCKLLESLDGSVTALAILKGVLEARKILMGPNRLKTLKTMENLGYWYFRYGWCQEGIAMLKSAVDGLKNLEATLETLKRLEQAYVDQRDHNRCPNAEVTRDALENLVTMDLLVEHCVLSHDELEGSGRQKADKFLTVLIARRTPRGLRGSVGSWVVVKYVLGAVRPRDKLFQHT